MGFSFLAAPETALIHTGWGFDKAAPKQLPNLSKALGWLLIAHGLHDLDALKPEGLSLSLYRV